MLPLLHRKAYISVSFLMLQGTMTKDYQEKNSQDCFSDHPKQFSEEVLLEKDEKYEIPSSPYNQICLQALTFSI